MHDKFKLNARPIGSRERLSLVSFVLMGPSCFFGSVPLPTQIMRGRLGGQLLLRLVIGFMMFFKSNVRAIQADLVLPCGDDTYALSDKGFQNPKSYRGMERTVQLQENHVDDPFIHSYRKCHS
jgi:hypothetical protein